MDQQQEKKKIDDRQPQITKKFTIAIAPFAPHPVEAPVEVESSKAPCGLPLNWGRRLLFQSDPRLYHTYNRRKGSGSKHSLQQAWCGVSMMYVWVINVSRIMNGYDVQHILGSEEIALTALRLQLLSAMTEEMFFAARDLF
jgi:hypothetical protein